MYKYNTPQELFTAICDKIRDRISNNELINHQDIPDKIDNLVDSDTINEYNELLSLIINQNTIIELNSNEIENINICFIGCTSLTTIDLPKCTSIKNNTFQNCTNLTTVYLPKCTSIESQAFSGCTNLTTVNLPECTSIDNNAFEKCTNLTTVNLPKCTFVEDVAFAHCTNLTTINLPECIYIKTWSFSDCTNLTTINLPKCTTINGTNTFENCTDLTTIILSNNQVVTLGNINVFKNSSIVNGTGYIYVPDNLVDSYKRATRWSNYANQIKPLSELPSNLKEEYGYE